MRKFFLTGVAYLALLAASFNGTAQADGGAGDVSDVLARPAGNSDRVIAMLLRHKINKAQKAKVNGKEFAGKVLYGETVRDDFRAISLILLYGDDDRAQARETQTAPASTSGLQVGLSLTPHDPATQKEAIDSHNALLADPGNVAIEASDEEGLKELHKAIVLMMTDGFETYGLMQQIEQEGRVPALRLAGSPNSLPNQSQPSPQDDAFGLAFGSRLTF